MSEARANILARLRRIEQQPGPELEQALERPVETYDWPREERIRRFSERMQAVRAEVHRVEKNAWAAKVLELAAQKGLNNLLYAPATAHGQALQAAAGENTPQLLPYAEDIEAWKDRLFKAIDGALTTSRGGIAETGSLILWPDADEPRLMSLVPPVHFALLDAERIYSSFAETVAEQNWSEGMPSNALLISGPSKSADIEQTLAYGVHGPKELVVLILE